MRPVIPYVVAALLFGLGTYGVLRRRNAILLLMAVELMLNAVNLILVAAGATVGTFTGQVFALFVIVIAAAEVGVGLAIVLQLYRLRASTAVDTVPLADPEPGADPAREPAPELATPRAPGEGESAAGPGSSAVVAR